MYLKTILVILISVILVSCWAPRCPMQSCHVKFEHLHEGGAYRGGSFIVAKKHWPWQKDEKYTASRDKKKDKKEKRKWKGLFDWERE